MGFAQALCQQIDEMQNRYADLFRLLEESCGVDPTEEADRAARLNADVARHQQDIEAAMPALRAALNAWQERPGDYPPGVDQYARQFLELLQSGIREALGLINQRTGELAARRDTLRQAIAGVQKHRLKVAGYRTQAHRSARMVDNDI